MGVKVSLWKHWLCTGCGWYLGWRHPQPEGRRMRSPLSKPQLVHNTNVCPPSSLILTPKSGIPQLARCVCGANWFISNPQTGFKTCSYLNKDSEWLLQVTTYPRLALEKEGLQYLVGVRGWWRRDVRRDETVYVGSMAAMTGPAHRQTFPSRQSPAFLLYSSLVFLYPLLCSKVMSRDFLLSENFLIGMYWFR